MISLKINKDSCISGNITDFPHCCGAVIFSNLRYSLITSKNQHEVLDFCEFLGHCSVSQIVLVLSDIQDTEIEAIRSLDGADIKEVEWINRNTGRRLITFTLSEPESSAVEVYELSTDADDE